MQTLARAWALALAHPMYAIPLLLVALVLLASAINRALPPGPPKAFTAKLIDRLAVLVRRGAVNGPWSWPLLGYSVFEAVRDSAREAWPVEDQPRGEGGFILAPVVRWVAAVVVLVIVVVGPLLPLLGCSPTLPADLYRGVGTGVAITAAGGRELALLEARECLAKSTRTEAEACLVPWRARWQPIALAWQGAAARSQSLAHVVRSVEADLARRWPVAVVDAGVADGGAL